MRRLSQTIQCHMSSALTKLLSHLGGSSRSVTVDTRFMASRQQKTKQPAIRSHHPTPPPPDDIRVLINWSYSYYYCDFHISLNKSFVWRLGSVCLFRRFFEIFHSLHNYSGASLSFSPTSNALTVRCDVSHVKINKHDILNRKMSHSHYHTKINPENTNYNNLRLILTGSPLFCSCRRTYALNVQGERARACVSHSSPAAALIGSLLDIRYRIALMQY